MAEGVKVISMTSEKLPFKSPEMNFQFIRALTQHHGGAEFGECFYAAENTKDGDPESWVKAWTEIASLVEARGEESLAKRHSLSARENFLRASNYYRAAEFYAQWETAQHQELWEKSQSCFRRAIPLFDPPIEILEIPFDDKILPGYFLPADSKGGKRPTLLVMGGYDSTGEELYFIIGAEANRRGYHALIFEGPGQRGVLHSYPDMIFRSDYEVPVESVVDYALTRPEIDGKSLALIGFSFGGYLAPRAVAFEKRIRALIANAPIVNFRRLVLGALPFSIEEFSPLDINNLIQTAAKQNPMFRATVENFLKPMGASTPWEFFEKISNYTIERLEDNITCPTLSLISIGEGEEAVAQARQFHEKLSCLKTLRIFTEKEGAHGHCQVNNRSLMYQVVFDWLDQVLEK
ncbi:MAG: alpha/beta hydrolase family protein [Candidatus Jordarchaeum sp.]|uniref:alpha/beta hydrolase family protein n=1 Tax=Candidatus Jordarchaeum sp. TaxID=2823881 RepID=UPI004049E369